MSTMCVVLLMAATSHGDVIVGATSVTSTSGSFSGGFALTNAINQSGLSANYTSGVTDFNSFVSATTHDSTIQSGTIGFAGSRGLPVFTFDLGSAIALDALAIWSTSDPGAVSSANVFADNDGDFSNGTSASLGSFTPTTFGNVVLADVFTFGPVTTQFIHLDTQSLSGGSDLFSSLGEVAFRTVPEPSSALLLSLAGLFAAVRRRR